MDTKDMKIIYKGNWFTLEEGNGKYWITCQEGICDVTAYYEIPKEHIEKAMKSDKDAYEVLTYAQTGHWPRTKEQELEDSRNFLRKCPHLLIKIPKNQEMFDEEELKILLKKGEEILKQRAK